MSRLAIPILALSLAASPLPAQDRNVLREARAEQARYELIRRNHLPWTDGGGGVCELQDERIGRFCLSFSDDHETLWRAADDDEAVIRARDRLIQRLDEAARTIPEDEWISGQRVRYLVEARRFDDADAAARECRATAWWCSALAGFVNHYADRPAAADSAFSAMLRAMPPDERRRWTDLSPILDDCTARAYRRLDGEERIRFQERFWALADPFFARPGNDLRSEQLARTLMDAFQDRARTTENISWGKDLREILIRYGAPVGWARVRPRFASMDSPALISHYANSDQRLLPPCEPVADGDLAAGVWDEEESRPRAGYSIPLADSTAQWIYPLDHQLAVFRRGDSAIVVAAYELPPDSLPDDATIEVALALMDGGASPIIARLPAAGTEGVLTAETAPGAVVASLEILSEDAGRVARSRQGINVPPLERAHLAVSDLLLLRSADALPDSLGAAVEAARGSTHIRPGEPIGVYWEMYETGGAGPDPLTLSLRLLDRRKGSVRRLAERIGIVRSRDPIRMQWQEPAVSSITARALTVQIPSELPPGRYTLELTATAPGQPPCVIERDVEIEDASRR